MEKFPEEIVKCTKCAILKIARFRENKWNLGPLQTPPQVYSGRVNYSQFTVNISALKSPTLLLTWCVQFSAENWLYLNTELSSTIHFDTKVLRSPKASKGTSRERAKKSQNSNFEGQMGQMSGVGFLIYFMDRSSTHTLYFNPLNCITCRV